MPLGSRHELHRSLSAITPEWVRALFAAALAPVDSASALPARPGDPRAFALARLLHAHDAVHRAVDAAAVSRLLRDPDPTGELPMVTGLMSAPLARIATLACGARTRIRTGTMRLAGTNPFVASFVPPAPGELARLLQALDAVTARAWQRAAKAGEDAVRRVAYTEYFALLAIHPLPDGNGRTARTIYASRVYHAGLCDERLLLAIPMTFAGHGARFHLATQLARAGAFDDLFANWRDALTATERAFAEPITALRAAAARNDVDAATRALESIRQTLIVAMA